MAWRRYPTPSTQRVSSLSLFCGGLAELTHAGAELVEIDLGADFHALSARTTWPIFFHETLPAVREFLAANEVPISFEQIYTGLGEHVRHSWSRSVMPSSADYVPDDTYRLAQNTSRYELRQPSSAGVPGITLPMGLNSEGLPLGLEIDAAAGRDRDLLDLTRVIERIVGPVHAPNGF